MMSAAISRERRRSGGTRFVAPPKSLLFRAQYLVHVLLRSRVLDHEECVEGTGKKGESEGEGGAEKSRGGGVVKKMSE